VIAGIVLVVAIAIAIALKIGSSSGGGGAVKPKRDVPHEKHADSTPAAPSAQPAATPIAATIDRDAQYKAASHDLETSATCTDRKAAVGKLVDLGDPRAIGELKAARYRMRGGVLGFGESNSNACLKADAEAAIKALGGTIR
jgi:hypothetical protein